MCVKLIEAISSPAIDRDSEKSLSDKINHHTKGKDDDHCQYGFRDGVGPVIKSFQAEAGMPEHLSDWSIVMDQINPKSCACDGVD